MIILASEDVGLADPSALVVAVDAFRALEVVGLPEAAYALTQAAVYLASAPKSNSMAESLSRARGAVEATAGAQVPQHLRSAVHEGQQALGDGVGYAYPHHAPDGVVAQQYLPDGAEQLILYEPGTSGTRQRWPSALPRPTRYSARPVGRPTGAALTPITKVIGDVSPPPLVCPRGRRFLRHACLRRRPVTARPRCNDPGQPGARSRSRCRGGPRRHRPQAVEHGSRGLTAGASPAALPRD